MRLGDILSCFGDDTVADLGYFQRSLALSV